MSATQSHAKNRGSKQTAAEKKEALAVAARRAQMQWYAVGFGAIATFVGAIVLISVFTEGELPIYGGHGGGY